MPHKEALVQPSRILPLHSTELDSSYKTPRAVVQSITMGVRIGANKYAIGAIHRFSFKMTRDVKTVYQIEPYTNVLGDDTSASGFPTGQGELYFEEDTKYWPGEAIEVIPGKMGTIDITLNRYVLYSANLMAAALRATGAGVYDPVPVPPNLKSSDETIVKYISILQQVRPFDIYQFFVHPATGKALWGRKFGGCWFRSIGEETPDSDQNGPVLENGEVVATYIRPLSTLWP